MGIFSQYKSPRKDKGHSHPHNIVHNGMHAQNRNGYPRIMSTQLQKQRLYLDRAKQADIRAQATSGLERDAYEASVQANLRKAKEAVHPQKHDINRDARSFRKEATYRARSRPQTLAEYLGT